MIYRTMTGEFTELWNQEIETGRQLSYNDFADGSDEAY